MHLSIFGQPTSRAVRPTTLVAVAVATSTLLLPIFSQPASAEMTAEEHYERGKQENLASKFAEAIADYDIAIKMQPDFWKAYANRASAEYYSKNYRAALNDINLALAHLPAIQSMTDLKTNIENAMKADTGRVSEVRTTGVRSNVTYNTINYGGGIPHTSAEQMLQLANIVMRSGHKIPANLIHPMDPNGPSLVHQQATSLIHPIGSGATTSTTTTDSTKSGSATTAVNTTTATATGSTLSAKDFLDRGTEKAKANDWNGAIADFDACIKLQPNNGLAWASRGSARISAGDLQGALTDLDKAVDLLPNEPQVKELRDKLRSALDQARQNLDKAGH